ncbi:hypothetical protein N7491_011236 [Penicillium cf. griseofulvum]|nr:hypothetical protein N7491_011236 [Penicillium cf. griseofulvum]
MPRYTGADREWGWAPYTTALISTLIALGNKLLSTRLYQQSIHVRRAHTRKLGAPNTANHKRDVMAGQGK